MCREKGIEDHIISLLRFEWYVVTQTWNCFPSAFGQECSAAIRVTEVWLSPQQMAALSSTRLHIATLRASTDHPLVAKNEDRHDGLARYKKPVSPGILLLALDKG